MRDTHHHLTIQPDDQPAIPLASYSDKDDARRLFNRSGAELHRHGWTADPMASAGTLVTETYRKGDDTLTLRRWECSGDCKVTR